MKHIIKHPNSFITICGIIFTTFLSFGQIEYTSSDVLLTGLSGGGVMDNISISPMDHNIAMLTSNMTGVYLTYNGPKDWKMIHHTELLYVAGAKACFHPKDNKIIFAPSGNKLQVTRDGGKTWNPIGNIGKIEWGAAIHPENTDLMLAGSGSGVWRSTDAGTTWVKATGPAGVVKGFHFDRTSPDVGGTCFAATASGIWRSDDGGATWTAKNSGLPATIVSFAGSSDKTTSLINLYCGADNKVYRSADKGESWTQLTSFTGNAAFLMASDANTRIVWAAVGGNNIRRSEDAGITWKQMIFSDAKLSTFNLEHNYFTAWMLKNVGNYSLYGAGIAPNNPDFFMFSTEMVAIYTDDGGKTWKNAHCIQNTGTGEPVPKSFYNSGLNVTTTWHYYVDPFDSEKQYLAYTDIGFARSVDKGSSWLFWPYWGPDMTIPFEWTMNLYEIAFDPEIPGKMWGAFSRAHDIPNGNAIIRDHVTKLADNVKLGGIGFSSDHAATWEDLNYNNGLPGRPTISVIVDPASPKNNRTLYAAVYEQGVYKSTDDGHNWVKKSTGLGSATNMHVVRVQLHKDGTLFALVTGFYSGGVFSSDGVGLYRSRNGGDSWEKANTGQTFLWPRDFTLSPNSSDTIYIGAHNAGSESGGLWRTGDGGATWTALARKGAHFGAYLHPNRPGWIYMTLCEGSDPTSGIWLSKNNGVTWTPYTKVPHKWIQRVDFDPRDDDVIYVATFGASALIIPADPSEQLSLSFKLQKTKEFISVYPNPCSEYLTIDFERFIHPVTYNVFDISGKLKLSAELHQKSNTIPIPLESGIYFISISIEGKNYFKKFVKS